jgi:hypothetical protein
MNETAILQNIRLDLGRSLEVKLFRNNVGTLPDRRGIPVQFGLHPGSGDLIGWRSITVTPEMVGLKLAIFLSVEVKTPSGRARDDQINWAQVVREAGGYAGIARSIDQARLIAGIKP